jgi:hypothetical protein
VVRRWSGRGPVAYPVAAWLHQEQVDQAGQRAGVAAIRVIAGYPRWFDPRKAAIEQEEEDGYLAAGVIPADELGWHIIFMPR